MSPTTLALIALLHAAPPGAEATRLAEQSAWEELYLRFAKGDPGQLKGRERSAIASALARGCEALRDADPILAFSLADRAGVYAPTVAGLKCLATTARRTQQLTVSEKALRDGARSFPKTHYFPIELARQLLDENDTAGAVKALAQVPASVAEAALLLKEAKRRLKVEAAEGHPLEQRPKVRTAAGSRAGETIHGSSMGAGGMRQRTSSRFVIRYFNNERDFGERAEYEGKIEAALDEAWSHTRKVLGETRKSPVNVVLYTRQEFALHHGEQNAQRIAGLYSQNAMRVNDAAELTRQTKATLVHEYVHAALDEVLSGRSGSVPTWVHEGVAEYVEWRYLGGDGPPLSVKARLRALALHDKQPHLTQLSRGMLVERADPALAYATSAVAVRLLLERGGTRVLLSMVRDLGQGMAIDDALKKRYSWTLEQLEEQVRLTLARR